MRGKVHISANCPITTFLKETRHSALSEHLKQKDAQSKFSGGGGVVQRNWKSHSKFCSDDTIYLFCLRTFNLSLHLKFYPSECDTVKELSSHSNQAWLRPKTPPNQSENIFWQNILKKIHLSTNIDKTQGKRIYLEMQVHENVINFKHLLKTKCVCLSDLFFFTDLKGVKCQILFQFFLWCNFTFVNISSPGRGIMPILSTLHYFSHHTNNNFPPQGNRIH